MIKHLDNEKEFDSMTRGKVLVDFYADWCGPCQMMGKLLESEEENLGIDVLKVNTDACPELATKMGVMSIPTLVLMEGEKELKRNVGFMSKEELEEFLK